ncbi:hypothetical protein Pelo_16912 [Pelomyxa schiedti]|nr:hypothetical protein Pelo_16912 [Pelomyxa schiedti]
MEARESVAGSTSASASSATSPGQARMQLAENKCFSELEKNCQQAVEENWQIVKSFSGNLRIDQSQAQQFGKNIDNVVQWTAIMAGNNALPEWTFAPDTAVTSAEPAKEPPTTNKSSPPQSQSCELQSQKPSPTTTLITTTAASTMPSNPTTGSSLSITTTSSALSANDLESTHTPESYNDSTGAAAEVPGTNHDAVPGTPKEPKE